MIIDFENIEEKCKVAASSPAYEELIDKFKAAKKIFLVGNGGLHFVSCHMSTDLSRLVPDKAFYSFDSVGFITSNSNDHGFEQVFVRWLESIASVEPPEETLVLGMSCSGNSSNVVQALHWAEERSISTFLISGKKSKTLNETVGELTFDCEYFHTVEVACMMLMYDMIHRLGSHCPSITKEIERMADSPLRN
jgi:phosphoheptose isomerase